MKRSGIAKAALAGATAAALAFGAGQALAEPSAPAPGEARACTDEHCRSVVCSPFPGVCRGGRCLCAG